MFFAPQHLENSGLIGRLGITLEAIADRVREAIFGAGRKHWTIGVQPYRCFGSAKNLRYASRVLRDPGLARPTIHDSILQNFKASFHRLESDEVAEAKIEISCQGQVVSTMSNDEGYCFGNLPLSRELESGWHTWRMKIDELPYGRPVRKHFEGECLIPSANAEFGIISDIDDTVMHTQVNSRLKMVLWSAFGNSYSRLPLPGVARLYRRLAEVDGIENVNPTFYVSSSPWNLYPLICEFLNSSDLPKGPLLLRDMGIGGGSSMGSDHSHKEANLNNILKSYPELRFILLGDSGEEDAAIYSRIIQRFPDRILCAYIRDTGYVDRGMIDHATLAASQAGSELILVPDSASIERHASEHGWL